MNLSVLLLFVSNNKTAIQKGRQRPGLADEDRVTSSTLIDDVKKKQTSRIWTYHIGHRCLAVISNGSLDHTRLFLHIQNNSKVGCVDVNFAPVFMIHDF